MNEQQSVQNNTSKKPIQTGTDQLMIPLTIPGGSTPGVGTSGNGLNIPVA